MNVLRPSCVRPPRWSPPVLWRRFEDGLASICVQTSAWNPGATGSEWNATEREAWMDAGVDAGDITVAAAAAAAADVNVMQHGGTDGRREDRWAQL